MTLHRLANETEPNVLDPEYVDTIAKMVNRYGFMIVFSVVILILIVVFFITHNSRAGKRQTAEMEILQQERSATIEQNKQMFNLVTKVQTEQVVQLRQMTETLKDMNRSIQDERIKLIETSESFERVKESVIECNDNSKAIITTLSEILDYVRTSQSCNQEVLEKVNMLEKNLIADVLEASK